MMKKGGKGKTAAALLSVGAAALLVSFKMVVALSTGSLGILSEALHSALDFVAAAVTWVAVKLSDKPADNEHNFGHGKIENFSALIEAFLLFATCGWIIFEAVSRLSSDAKPVEVGFWSFAVVITSILVDVGRSRALMKAAKKYKVAIIVIWVSVKLSLRAIDELLDKAPDGIREKVAELIGEVDGVIKSHSLRVRSSGDTYEIDVNIHVAPTLSIVEAHDISERVEKVLREKLGKIMINVHVEPQ